MDTKMTVNDEEVDEIVKDLKKMGINVVAYGKAKDLLKLMEEKEYSKKTKEENK